MGRFLGQPYPHLILLCFTRKTECEICYQNENGDNTKKLTIEYECILGKEGSGETKNISGTAEIAVAYPG